MGEHGFPQYVQNRVPGPVAQLVHGEQFGALPSHHEKITSKIEEQPEIVIAIGWIHVWRVMALYTIAIAIGHLFLLYEVVGGRTFAAMVGSYRRQRIRIKQRYIRSKPKPVGQN